MNQLVSRTDQVVTGKLICLLKSVSLNKTEFTQVSCSGLKFLLYKTSDGSNQGYSFQTTSWIEQLFSQKFFKLQIVA